MAQSQISSNTTEDSSQERSSDALSSGSVGGGTRVNSVDSVSYRNSSGNGNHDVPPTLVLLHNLTPFVYDEDGTTPLDWWCTEPGCDYSFGQEQVIQGEVIASAESQAVPRNKEIALPPQDNSTDRTEKCAGGGKVRKTNIQVPILPRLAPNKSRGPKA